MKKSLRKKKTRFNFYEYQVRHGFNHNDIYDLLIPSTDSDWEYVGYDAFEVSHIYKYTCADRTQVCDHQKHIMLDEVRLFTYLVKVSIDFILDNDIALKITNEPTRGQLKYV